MITRDRSIVERCFLMNLDRREDRLKEWLQQLFKMVATADEQVLVFVLESLLAVSLWFQ